MPTASAPLINAIRALEMDAVQQVNFVHPGVPMGMPDIAEVRWRRQLRDNPANPDWPEPNRSVLSNGHGSMPIFTLLHLGSDDVSIDDPQNFHQFVSKTPVHPEVDHPPRSRNHHRAGRLLSGDVLPHAVPRLAIEAGVGSFWCKYVGLVP